MERLCRFPPIAILVALLALPFVANAQQPLNPVQRGVWRQLPSQPSDPPMNLAHLTSLCIDGLDVYVLGRVGPYLPVLSTSSWTNAIWRFSFDDETWTLMVNWTGQDARTFHGWYPYPVTWTGNPRTCVAYGGSVHEGDDTDIINTWVLYDIDANNATTSTSVGGSRQNPAVVRTSDDVIYAYGGASSSCANNLHLMQRIDIGGASPSSTDIDRAYADADGNPLASTCPDPEVCMIGRTGHSGNLIEWSEIIENPDNTTTTIDHRWLAVFGGHQNPYCTDCEPPDAEDGKRPVSFLSDLWYFDIDAETWTKLEPEGAKPTARCYHAAASSGEFLFIFGGDGEPGSHFQDFWVYGASFNRWVFLSSSSSSVVPGRRAQSAMAYVPDLNALVMYGGFTHDPTGNNDFISDFWIYGLGCPNDCSGNGQCIQVACVCDDCYSGEDCSERQQTAECGGGKRRVVEKDADEDPWEIIGAVLGAVLGAFLLCFLLALLVSLLIMSLYWRWKRSKKAAAAGGGKRASKEEMALEEMDDPFGEKKQAAAE